MKNNYKILNIERIEGIPVTLSILRDLINEVIPKERGFCEIEEMWIDFGAKWKETALLMNVIPKNLPKDYSYQLLNPFEVEKISVGAFYMSDAYKVINRTIDQINNINNNWKL